LQRGADEPGSVTTPIHEAVHPIVWQAGIKDPYVLAELSDKINALAQSGYEPAIKAVIHASNPGYSPAEVPHEMVTEFITQVIAGEGDISALPQSLQDQILKLINEVLKMIGVKPIPNAYDLKEFTAAVKKAFDTASEGYADVTDVLDVVGRNHLSSPFFKGGESNRIAMQNLMQSAPEFEQLVSDIVADVPDITVQEIMEEVEASRPEMVATPELRANTQKRVEAILQPQKTPFQRLVEQMQQKGVKLKSLIAKTKDELSKIVKNVFNITDEESQASAELMHIMVEKMAQLNGISVAEQYQRIAFGQGDRNMTGALYQDFFKPSDFDDNGNVKPEVLAEIAAERAEIERAAKQTEHG